MFRIRLRGRGEDEDWRHLCGSYERVVKPTDTVLEIGASVPKRTRWLAARCRDLIGVELFPERVPAASNGVRYVVGDWQRLSEVVSNESIDVAVSSHVIEHVPDDRRALAELYAVLRPGGVALLTTPNRKRLPRVIIERVQGERSFPWWEHVREYAEDDLRALWESSPFRSAEIRGVALGLHGGPVYCYVTRFPRRLRRYANFWELELRK
ncbi:MAG: class I SAM-dependent methyltransferase [Candidatus Eremiobacteraeota bacterium]|nr:class I SAM-dependent methyltransferase [Candidatus Eremiobacteraeota bacterium]